MIAARSEMRRFGPFAQRFRALEQIVVATTSSTMPEFERAFGRRWTMPLSMNSSAARAPISRGRRCVPPAPGKQPELDLRQAEFRAGVATR